jgi:CheY-like chemotaxis protein
MGGELGVRSAIGRGSAFFFDIPLVQAEPSAAQAAEEEEPMPGSRLAPECSITALVADDSSVNRRILASLLESAGAQVITASGGVEAVELTTKYRPNVVLMDLRMDDMDGLDATRAIKAAQETAGIPVIMVTASAFGDSREAALEAGCVDFIVKPIQAENLFQKLQIHLNVRFVPLSEEAPEPSPVIHLPSGGHIEAAAARIHEAVSIGNVSDLEALALELSARGDLNAALGAHIGRLTSSFDFPALLELARRMSETAQRQSRRADSTRAS